MTINPDVDGWGSMAIALPRTVATRAAPRAGSRLGHSATIALRKENERGD